MSIHTITCDEFSMLTPSHHRLAIRLYSAEITSRIAYLAEHPTGEDHEEVSNDLLETMQLRKLHIVRLEEMNEEKTPISNALAA